MLALCALISALTTLRTLPLAITWHSSSSIVMSSPALHAEIYASTSGDTLMPRHFIPIRRAIDILTPDTAALNHILIGNSPKIRPMTIIAATTPTTIPTIAEVVIAKRNIYTLLFCPSGQRRFIATVLLIL